MGRRATRSQWLVEIFGKQACCSDHHRVTGTHDSCEQGCEKKTEQPGHGLRQKGRRQVSVDLIGLHLFQRHATLLIPGQGSNTGDRPGRRAHALDQITHHKAEPTIHFSASGSTHAHDEGLSHNAHQRKEGKRGNEKRRDALRSHQAEHGRIIQGFADTLPALNGFEHPGQEHDREDNGEDALDVVGDDGGPKASCHAVDHKQHRDQRNGPVG